MIYRAIDVGARLAIGTDAHTPEHFDFLELGVLTVRRGWAEARHVLNALPVREFRQALKRSGTS